MTTPPGYFEPRVRRSFTEWLYDLLIPPSPYEAKQRALLLEQAKRTALRTAVQAERIKARQQRMAERERLEREIRDRYVLAGLWELNFLHADKPVTLFVELRETNDCRLVRAVRLVDKRGAVLPSELIPGRWDFAKTLPVYVQYIRPWMDGFLTDEDLRDVHGVTLASRSTKTSEKNLWTRITCTLCTRR